MYKTLLLSTILCSFLSFLDAQTPISGIINQYTEVVGIDIDCKSLLQVNDTTGFQKGQYLLIIQMQGAEIINSNNNSYGNISNLREAGKYEKAKIDSVALGEIYLENLPLNDYNLDGSVQVVSIPTFVNIAVTDTLRAAPWNGRTGGVLILEAEDTIQLQSAIIVSGQGFRGGTSTLNLPNNCQWFINNNDYRYNINSWRSSPKGEGIAKVIAGEEAGRGALANAGGGGNDHNAGGGGGAHYGMGGKGGENDEPSTFGCKGRNPGEGGRSLSTFISEPRVFMGGGGGAGHANNFDDSNGSAGGGIVILISKVLQGNNQSILANGNDAFDLEGDGAGGGGAGGSILLLSSEIIGDLQLNVNGGSGGDVSNLSDRCMGPGGGGAAGYILNNSFLTPNVIIQSLGGQNGLSIGGACGTSATNGAQAGDDALFSMSSLDSLVYSSTPVAGGFAFLTQPQSTRICAGDQTVFILETQGTGVSYQWQVNQGGGFMDITNNANYTGAQNSQLLLNNISASFDGYRFRCLVSSDCATDFPSFEAVLQIVEEPEITSNPQDVTVCENDPANFSITSNGVGLVYQWQIDMGSGFMNISNTGIYSGTDQSTLNISSSSSAAVYRCSVQDSCGVDLFSADAQLMIIGLPNANFGFTASNGNVSFGDLSMNADTWSWDFGDGQSSTIANPMHTYSSDGTYTVTLTITNACGISVFTQQVTISLQVAPEAIFSSDRIRGCAPVVIQYKDESNGTVDNRLWTFEGGTPATSTDAEPEVTYNTAGVFDVTLEVSNSAGNNVIFEDDLIEVAAPAFADFTYTEDELVFTFQNLSTNANTFQWNFGDGSPTSTEENPVHEYAMNGAYTVTLIASNDLCASALSIPVDINVVSIESFLNEYRINIFPNPAVDFLNIEIGDTYDELNLRMISQDGRTLLNEKIRNISQHQMDLSILDSGLYFLELRTGKAVGIYKLVVGRKN